MKSQQKPQITKSVLGSLAFSSKKFFAIYKAMSFLIIAFIVGSTYLPVNASMGKEPVNRIEPQPSNLLQSISNTGNDPLSDKQGEVQNTFENPSILFIENVGQFDEQIRYVAFAANATVYFSEQAIWYIHLESEERRDEEDPFQMLEERLRENTPRKGTIVKLDFPGSNPKVTIERDGKVETTLSYFLGSEEDKQHTDVPVWSKLTYKDIYPGMNLEISSEGSVFSWNFVVADSPAFNASNKHLVKQGIKVMLTGHKSLKTNNKKTFAATTYGNISLPKLYVDGKAVSPSLDNKNYIIIPLQKQQGSQGAMLASISLPQLEPSGVISNDAQSQNSSNLLIAMLFGGEDHYDGAWGVAAGSDGSLFATGIASSPPDFYPEMTGDVQFYGGNDAFALKVNADGSIGYLAFIGGDGSDQGYSIKLNDNDEAYLAGFTTSSNFQTSPNAISNSGRGFLVKLSSDGSQILYSTRLGNDTFAHFTSMDIDENENVYMLDRRADGSNSSPKGKVYKLTPGNSEYEYVYPLGSGKWRSIAVSDDGRAYVSGTTLSSNGNVLVTSISETGTLVYSISYGGSGAEAGDGVAVDASGFAYVTGFTSSTNLPVIGSQVTTRGIPWHQVSYIAIFDPSGSLVYSSYIDLNFGFTRNIAIDDQNNLYFAGATWPLYGEFPFTDGAVWTGTPDSNEDIFIIKLTPSIVRESYQITYATLIGGSEADYVYSGADQLTADNAGNVYVVGETYSTEDFVGVPSEGYFYVDTHTFVVKIATGGPVYDCSGYVASLSPIAQAVYAEVESDQEFCGNYFDSLITLPPGEQAFQRFHDLASAAHYEVDFTTMIWEEGAAGESFLTGIKELYDKVQNPVANDLPSDYFSSGVRVRILVGLQKYALGTGQDQRVLIMRQLDSLGVGPNDSKWTVEVAVYRDGRALGNHSHVKTMIVDGKTIIVGGYNVQNDYLNLELKRRDMGVQVSGPIALRDLMVFDELWMGAIRCDSYLGYLCWDDNNEITDIPHNLAILVPTPAGNEVVFSLFRDDTNKTADNAIVAAINAANINVNIMQDRFINSYMVVRPYARAILDVIEKQGTNPVSVKLLISGTNETLWISTSGICELENKLRHEDQSKLQYFEARSSRFPVHTKALSIDKSFLIVGSQNFDDSAWGNFNGDYDLAEYNMAIDSTSGVNSAADEFDSYFNAEWDPTNTNPIACLGNLNNLQSEIDQAPAGSIFFIPAGVYTESVTINKPLVLVGAGANQTIIQPDGNEPAFRVTSSNVTIMSMKISGGSGYGVELIDSSPHSLKDIQIYRVVFENNAQGGVLAQGLIPGSPMNYAIENNTFIGGANGVIINMIDTQAETSFIRDNIFSAQSEAPIHILSADDSRVEYSYNLFDDCGLGACFTNWRLGNISTSSTAHDNLFDQDPLFSSPEHGAYQLSSDSPAIDTGDPSLLHDLYLDGDNDGAIRIDLGAFEYVPSVNVSPVVYAGDDQTVEIGSSVTVNTSYSDADDSENHSARINWGDEVIEDVPTNITGLGVGEVSGLHTYANPGIYIVEVCIVDIHGGVGCDTLSVAVPYPFTGFFAPVDNQPILNVVKAGSAIPLKFSLDGYQGLNIFSVGYPASVMVSCGSSVEDAIEQTVTAGGSSLSYDATTDQYIYVWKTDQSWADTCRTLVLKLNDGSYHRADFKFKK